MKCKSTDASNPLTFLWIDEALHGQGSGRSQRKAQDRQVTHPIREGQLHFIPVAITTFGALGPKATEFVDDTAVVYSAQCAVDRGLCRKQLVEPSKWHSREMSANGFWRESEPGRMRIWLKSGCERTAQRNRSSKKFSFRFFS